MDQKKLDKAAKAFDEHGASQAPAAQETHQERPATEVQDAGRP